jgi:hypothetical protein
MSTAEKTVAPPAAPPSVTRAGVTLCMTFRLAADGDIIAREIVQESDLMQPMSEVWLHGCLRLRRRDITMDRLSFSLLRGKDDGNADSSRDFRIAATLPDGKRISLPFTSRSLSQVVTRVSLRLSEAGAVTAEDVLHYGLEFVEPQAVKSDALDPQPKVGQFVVKSSPPACLSVSIGDLLQQAKLVGEVDALDYPVFYTEEALAAAEKYARRGAAANPPVESGAALVGPLCACPDTNEVFSVVTGVIEASDAEEGEYAMAYSARTWQRIGAVMQALRSRPATRAHRILGQAHGHNFAPGQGAPPCEACASRAKCSRTTVYVSSDDVTWSRSVFSGEPWGLCHIFGRTARDEHVNGLFGMRDGTLLERGYYVIPNFMPSATG